MDIKIVVATHKKYPMPEDEMYIPLHVGAERKSDTDENICNLGYVKDNTGDNISAKNPFFCELTGLYWSWKNLDADYIGLVHYRRHFTISTQEHNMESVLTKNQLETVLKYTDIVLPKKRRYYIETVYSHYANTHYADHLHKTRSILADKYPDYLESFDYVMKSRSAHMFNMFIMKRNYLNRYCTWLFDILFELEKQIDVRGMSPFEARLFGRISELLLDVWIMENRIHYKEIGYIYMEPVDWKKKAVGFLRAKYFKEKYSASW